MRFSENKRKSQDSSGSGRIRGITGDLPQELLELRKQNAYLKMEMDKLKKQNEKGEDYQNKFRDLRHDFKTLQEDLK